MNLGDWLERIPYISLVAFILVVTGCGIMSGTNFEALKRVDNFFEDRFYPISQPLTLQTLAIAFSILTILFSITNVVVGTLTTGDTRHKIYTDKDCIRCGQNLSRCLILIAYLFTFLWLLMFIAMAIPVTLWTMLHIVCREETTYWRSISSEKDEREFSYTFNLTHYGTHLILPGKVPLPKCIDHINLLRQINILNRAFPLSCAVHPGLYRRPLDTSLWSEYINSPSAFTHLCQQISTVGPLFASALLATFFVLLGLITFVACLSNSIIRLQYFAEVENYRRLVNSSPHTGPTSLDEYALQPLIQQPHSIRESTLRVQSSTLGRVPNVSGYGQMDGTPASHMSIPNSEFAHQAQLAQQQYYSQRQLLPSACHRQSLAAGMNY